MKYLIVTVALCCINSLSGAQSLSGTITDSQSKPLAGASVRLLNADISTTTDKDGIFSIPSPSVGDTLFVSFVGYLSRQAFVAAGETGPLTITLEADPRALEEVVINTGYYQAPLERATGAFTHIDNNLLNRAVSNNILQRLEGIANGVQFVDAQANDASGIRIRGLSTIEADTRPLIVVDNFPYEGDINTLNPNDVESITVLRDAAAASIWGARAGNGVIVINTKQGSYDQPPRISVNSNVTIGERPNLLYNQNYLPASTVMAIQKEMFERGAYAENPQTYLPSYVELLIKRRDNLISEEEFARQEAFMQQTDLRKDVMRYLYQPSVNQQYSINIRGGGGNYLYALSAGYDANSTHVVGDENNRLNLSLQNTFRVRPELEVTGSFWYTDQRQKNNGITGDDLGLFGPYAYTQIYDGLIDVNGQPGITYSQYRQAYREQAAENGLLDWMYRPLQNRSLLDNTAGSREIRLNAGVRYAVTNDLSINGAYQFVSGNSWEREYHAPASYFVRNLVNRFTQPDGTRIIPYGGILELGPPGRSVSHAIRMQANINKLINVHHQFTALAGSEIRRRLQDNLPDLRLYDYNDELWLGQAIFNFATYYPTLPSGSAAIPASTRVIPYRTTGHDLSYFGNGAYTYKDKYTLTTSLRWDGSNLLGVRTNQRGTVLWSLGTSWEVTKESFFAADWASYLRLRITYGSAGNIDRSQSHYPTISLSTSPITGLTTASLTHAGNPTLRWEQVNTLNIGIDWRLFSNRIRGSIEYYNKHAKDLLGENLMDPATGVGGSYRINYANLRTQGWDIQLETENLRGPLKWSTNMLFNYTANRVTHYNGPEESNVSAAVAQSPVKKGQSVDLVYSLPWYGLNPQTGYPLIYLNGEVSDDYNAYYNSLTLSDLVISGLRVPPYYGSIRNTFRFKGWEVSALFSYEFGAVFRRSSIGPGQEYVSSPVYHMDYFKRWQQPGDEQHTNVPAWAETVNPTQRFVVYLESEALITNADFIRLTDLTLSYSLPNRLLSRLPFRDLRCYAYSRNWGIIWRANREGIDPDYVNSSYVAPRSFALGIQVEF